MAEFIPHKTQPKWSDVLTFRHPRPNEALIAVAVYISPCRFDAEQRQELKFRLASAGIVSSFLVLLIWPLAALLEAPIHFCFAEHYDLNRVSSGQLKMEFDVRYILGMAKQGCLSFSINTGGFKASSLSELVLVFTVPFGTGVA